jgi:hypothetical protein
MLAGETPARYLVIQPECGYCGMCNRLNAILGSYMLAVLLGRALVIDWTWEGRWFAKGTRYLEPNLIDWQAQSAVGKPYFKSDPGRTRCVRGCGILGMPLCALQLMQGFYSMQEVPGLGRDGRCEGLA